MNKGNDITAKEAYNLLSGRAVMKAVEVAEKLSLLKKDAGGKTVAESKVKDLDEAKEKISTLVKKETEKQSGSYELQYRDQPIRTFNSDGKSKPLKADRLEMIHHYVETASNENKSTRYPVESLKEAKALIQKIAEEKKAEHQTRDFALSTPQSKLPSYRFDEAGKELNIAPDSRKENIWIKMDLENPTPKGEFKFRKFYENYGFDLMKELDKLSPVEMREDHQKERLLGCLKRGNLQMVNLEREDSRESHYIAANPQFKKLDVYDKGLKEVNQNKRGGEEKTVEEGVFATRGR